MLIFISKKTLPAKTMKLFGKMFCFLKPGRVGFNLLTLYICRFRAIWYFEFGLSKSLRNLHCGTEVHDLQKHQYSMRLKAVLEHVCL